MKKFLVFALAVLVIGALATGALALEASIDFDPDTLNRNSKGKWVTVYIEFPDGTDVNGIDVGTVELDGLKAEWGEVQDDVLMVKFDRPDVQEILELGDEVEITVTGEVDGTPFLGTDTIRVIERGNP